MNQTLAIIIITNRNDARFQKALASSQWADTVLIVDHNSQNDWNTLRKRFTFSVVKYEKDVAPNFSNIRNLALEKVEKAHWILFLDSDEWISPELKNDIEQILSTSVYESGFYLPRKDFFLGKILKYGETGSLALLRLARKDAGKWKGNVHETWQINGEVGMLNSPIFHEPHLSISRFIEKISRYSASVADERIANHQHFSLFQALIYPIAKFVDNYFFKLGFLDGWRGFIYAIIMSMHSSSVRISMYEKNKK